MTLAHRERDAGMQGWRKSANSTGKFSISSLGGSDMDSGIWWELDSFSLDGMLSSLVTC